MKKLKQVMETPEAQEAVTNLKSNAVHYWYVIVIVVMLAFSVFQWQSHQGTKKELAEQKAKMTIVEDIKTLEQKLDAMKLREASYGTLESSNERLLKAIAALEKKRKELEKKNKEVLLNEIKKMDEATLVSTFGALGISGSVSECGP